MDVARKCGVVFDGANYPSNRVVRNIEARKKKGSDRNNIDIVLWDEYGFSDPEDIKQTIVAADDRCYLEPSKKLGATHEILYCRLPGWRTNGRCVKVDILVPGTLGLPEIDVFAAFKFPRHPSDPTRRLVAIDSLATSPIPIRPPSTHNVYHFSLSRSYTLTTSFQICINSNEALMDRPRVPALDSHAVSIRHHSARDRNNDVSTALETPHRALATPSPVTNAWLPDFLLQVPNTGYQQQSCIYEFG
ncbi:hypothetical protein EDB85DRAFT_2252725 [Lactarius pseudohatsudake]|nr:hypothetical protein EDB85DRAFT_2252725 [Lactarius pseudohatsudake]